MREPDAEPESAHAQQIRVLSGAALRSCVEAAVAAPSLHNSQPWRFRIGSDGVDVYADRSRQLQVIDPAGRELVISVGAAVFNLKVAIHQHGRVPRCHPWPDPDEPDLAAGIRLGPAAPPEAAIDALAAAIPRRRTNRRPFERVVIPADTLEALSEAAVAEGATLRTASAVARTAVLSLVHTAERRLRAQGRYRAELTEWTLPARGRRDGVPPQAFGPWAALETMPLRDFGLTQPQLHRRREQFEPYPTILVLSTNGDTADQWLQAGQALQRILLVATIHGLAATPMSQPLEIPELRNLFTATGTGQWAQVVLRLGYGQPVTATPRRPVADVLMPPP
jgi:nitroreductase